MIAMRSVRQLVVVGAVALASASCGNVVRDSRSPVMLVMNSLQAAQGGTTLGQYGGILYADVITLVTTPAPCSSTSPCATIFADVGQATVSLVLKDIGTPGNPTTPTTNNAVTITRYHVDYTRADGRNTPGVDVPYAIDGGVTATITGTTTTTLSFEIVRHTSKEEPPLVNLRTSGGVAFGNSTIISTIATVTLYGTDQVGNDISVSGKIQIDFGDFGDRS